MFFLPRTDFHPSLEAREHCYSDGQRQTPCEIGWVISRLVGCGCMAHCFSYKYHKLTLSRIGSLAHTAYAATRTHSRFAGWAAVVLSSPRFGAHLDRSQCLTLARARVPACVPLLWGPMGSGRRTMPPVVVLLLLLVVLGVSLQGRCIAQGGGGLTRGSFPKGFVFGTAAAAYQVGGSSLVFPKGI